VDSIVFEEMPTADGGLEVRSTVGKGEGVFAARSFQRGEIVLVGVITHELDRNHSHASQLGEHRFVIHGGLVPKVNHSCEPNCGIRPNPTGAHDLVARSPIAASDEITFDYAMRNYGIEHFPGTCGCSTAACRGRTTGWKDLPAQRKADYTGFVAPYLLDLDSRGPTWSNA